MSIAQLLVLCVGMGLCALIFDVHAQPAPAAVNEATEQSIQKDIAAQNEILIAPDSRPEQREQAAARLLLRQKAESRAFLLDTLSENKNRAAQLAVARALAGDTLRDPAFVEPLQKLMGRDWSATEAAVGALASFQDNKPVLTELINFAANSTMVPKSRIATVRGIGAFVNIKAAAFLIKLIQNTEEDSQVRNAAMDALVDMTGLQSNGRDTGEWNKWWDANRAKPEEQWKAEQFQMVARHYDQKSRELQKLRQRIQIVLKRDYQAALDEAQRTSMILSWLKDSEPSIRIVAAIIVSEQKINGDKIALPATEQLRSMIGDSSAEVRIQVISTLREINDPAAAVPLLNQLAVERDSDVIIAIAQTLGRLQQIKAVESLLGVVKMDSNRVAESGVDALRNLSEPIRANADLYAQVCATLRNRLNGTGPKLVSDSLRGALIEALGQLRDTTMLQTFIAALDTTNPKNAVPVRVAACKGLGGMIDAKDREQAAGELVNTMRRDPEAAVRLEAVKNIELVGTFSQADAVYQQALGSRESDKSVRDAAYALLVKMYKWPDASVNALLFTWLERFKITDAIKGTPQVAQVYLRRLDVLLAARGKLIKESTSNADPASKESALEKLATIQQYIAEAYENGERWEEAVASYRASLDYYQTRKNAAVDVTSLSERFIRSLLRSASYTESTQFAASRITAAPTETESISYLFRTEIERLKDSSKPDDWRSAVKLIEEIAKMRPTLKSHYADKIAQYHDEIKGKLKGI